MALTCEELFQEAKKIVTACIQHITYNEWLPALLGINYTKENGLGLEQRTTYDETADPTVSNSFATAVLPFTNSMISDSISFNWTSDGTHHSASYDGSLKRNYNQPILLGNFENPYGINRMLIGLTVQATEKVDMLFTQSVSLLDTINIKTFLDIQQSRDHGIPSYTQFRKYCGLKDIENMQDLPEIMVEGSADKLLKLYKIYTKYKYF
ncbi:peroxidase-like protein 3 [Metopolophium dirhodum]|uniref:peroxidase-like protein 3 n=1 Tax=Metopolophium dirhodum TaxID=44670 RepID=UPI00298F74C5|nr:peroxidase-like protein 3 [Metopolophium dirhodum]